MKTIVCSNLRDMEINKINFKKRFLGSVISVISLFNPIISIGPVSLGIAVSNIHLFGGKAIAQDASAVARIAKAITVRIEGATQGSGIIVEKNENTYTVLTAWHVIKDQNKNEELDIYTPDGLRHSANPSSVKRIDDVDIAIVKFTSKNNYQIPIIERSSRVDSGAESYVSGYPLATTAVPRRILRFTKGSVIANAQVYIPKGYQLLYSNSTYPGMSGGSVLNSEGKLIGIHGQGEIDSMATKANGIAVKTGTNQAVPIKYYLQTKANYSEEIKGLKSDNDYKINGFENFIVKSKSLLEQYNIGLKSEEKDDLKRKYLSEKQYILDEAISNVEQALTIKENPEAHLIAGTGYLYKKSAHLYNNYDSSWPVRDSKERSEWNREDRRLYDKVLSNLDKAIYLEPENIDALKYRGSLKEDDELGAGIGDFNKMLAIDYRNLDALRYRSIAYYGLGMSEDLDGSNTSRTQRKAYFQLAIEDFDRILIIEPANHESRFNRGHAKFLFYNLVKQVMDEKASTKILRESCIDAYDAVSSGYKLEYPNLFKDHTDACINLAKGITNKKYNPYDESTIPASFSLHKKYKSFDTYACPDDWSNRQCSFHKQVREAFSLEGFNRCMMIYKGVTRKSASSVLEDELAKMLFISPEVVQVVKDAGGIDSQMVIDYVEKNGISACDQ